MLPDQLEFQLADLEEDVAQAEAAAAAKTITVSSFERRKPARPVHCPRIWRASASFIPRVRSATERLSDGAMGPTGLCALRAHHTRLIKTGDYQAPSFTALEPAM